MKNVFLHIELGTYSEFFILSLLFDHKSYGSVNLNASLRRVWTRWTSSERFNFVFNLLFQTNNPIDVPSSKLAKPIIVTFSNFLSCFLIFRIVRSFQKVLEN